MPPSNRGISAQQLVRDFGANLDALTEKVDALLTRLSEAEATLPVVERRREICTAIWAAITASFEASTLSSEEREKIVPLVQEVLVPYWHQHCAAEPEMAELLATRATLYLNGRDERSQVATASLIVSRLLDAIGAAEDLKPRLANTLAPLFAHRMLGKIHHINDLKSRFGIQLPIVAVICATAEVVAAYEPALRVLRWG
jgi:hypothetical protein